MWSNCLFVALGGGLGAVGRYLLSLIAAPWSFPVMTLLTNFLGGGGHRRRGPGGGTAAHVQKCSSVFEDRTLRWFYHLFHFFTGDGGAAGAGEMGRRGRVHPGQRGSVPGGGAAGAGPGVEDPLRMETRI